MYKGIWNMSFSIIVKVRWDFKLFNKIVCKDRLTCQAFLVWQFDSLFQISDLYILYIIIHNNLHIKDMSSFCVEIEIEKKCTC